MNSIVEFCADHDMTILACMMGVFCIFMFVNLVFHIKSVNKYLKDQDDRTVERLDIEQIRAVLFKDAEARGIDMTDKEVKFFASRDEGFLGARVMRKKKNENPE